MDETVDRRDHLRLASSQPLSLINGSNDHDPVDEPLADGTPRPALTSIAVKLDGDRIEATAVLALHGRVLTGSCIGDAAERTSVVASATLGAVSGLLDFDVHVDSARIVDVTGHDVALSILRLDTEDPRSGLLVGSALVRGDTEDATARSVLSALNRRLSQLPDVGR